MEQRVHSETSLTQHLLALEQEMLAEHGPAQTSWVIRRLGAVLAALDVGQHGQAMGYGLRALELAAELNDPSLQARAHVSVALIYSDNYDRASAEYHFSLARKLAPPGSDALGRVITNLAHHLVHGRAYLEAYQELAAHSGLFAALGDLMLVTVYHVNMIAACVPLYHQGVEPLERWRDQVQASAGQLRRLQHPDHPVAIRMDVLDSFAQHALMNDDPQQALGYTEQRIELGRQAGSPILLGSAYRQLGQIWQTKHHWPAAIAAFSEALKSYGEGQQYVSELELREELAAAHASSGDYRAAYLVQKEGGKSGLLMEQILRQRAQIGAVERQVMEADWRATIYREASERDFLTGVANRARAVRILDALQHSIEGAEVQQAAVAIFDLDHFKQVNDQYGHDVGDQVLIAVAGQVQASIREQDQLSRHGGEEFLLILHETSVQEALQVCNRLRLEIEHLHLPSWPDLRVTASFGISVMRPSLGVQDALRMADAQLYRSKRAGRNRVSGLGYPEVLGGADGGPGIGEALEAEVESGESVA